MGDPEIITSDGSNRARGNQQRRNCRDVFHFSLRISVVNKTRSDVSFYAVDGISFNFQFINSILRTFNFPAQRLAGSKANLSQQVLLLISRQRVTSRIIILRARYRRHLISSCGKVFSESDFYVASSDWSLIKINAFAIKRFRN